MSNCSLHVLCTLPLKSCVLIHKSGKRVKSKSYCFQTLVKRIWYVVINFDENWFRSFYIATQWVRIAKIISHRHHHHHHHHQATILTKRRVAKQLCCVYSQNVSEAILALLVASKPQTRWQNIIEKAVMFPSENNIFP